MTRVTGRIRVAAFVCGITALGMFAASEAGNIIDVTTPPCPWKLTDPRCVTYIDPHWHAPAWGVIWAVVIPFAVALTALMLELVPWPPAPPAARWWQKRWVLVRVVGVIPSWGIAAVISYSHLRAALLRAGENVTAADFGAAIIDAVTIVATGGLMAIAEHVRAPAEAVAEDPAAADDGDADDQDELDDQDDTLDETSTDKDVENTQDDIPNRRPHIARNPKVEAAAAEVAEILRRGDPMPGKRKLCETYRVGQVFAGEIQDLAQLLAREAS